MDIQVITAAVTASVELLKSLGGLVSQIGNKALQSQFQEKVIELNTQIMTIQTNLIELRNVNERLREELRKDQDYETLKKELKLERNAYWKDGVAYCLACFDRDHRLQTLAQLHGYAQDAHCPACGKSYQRVFGDPPIGRGPAVV